VAIESLKATEYANLKIASDQLKGTVYRIAQRMIDLASRYFISPKTVTMMEDGKPTYFDIIGERGMETQKRLAEKSQTQVPEATVIRKDYNIEIDVQSGMGFTEEGKRTTMMQLIDYSRQLAAEGLLTQDALNIIIKNFMKTFQFGNTAEFMEALENGTQAGQAGVDKSIQAVKVGVLEAMKEAGEIGPEASDKRIQENKVGVLEALKESGLADKMNGPEDNPELAPIPYKDAPEDIKRQMEANAGLTPSQMVSPTGTDQAIKVQSAQQSQTQAEQSHELSVAQFQQTKEQAEKSNELQEKALKQKGVQRGKTK
jgi:hypothetical protein